MFTVSTTREGVTYTIGAEDFGTFVDDYTKAEGLDGFMCAVAELHQVNAERAIAPLAKPDQDEPESQGDELVDLIRNAPDDKALIALWRAHKAKWNDDYNKLADKRKRELAKQKG